MKTGTWDWVLGTWEKQKKQNSELIYQSTDQPVNGKPGRLGKIGKVAKQKIVQIVLDFGGKFANRLS